MKNTRHIQWRLALLEAVCISSVILGLYYYWFGLANRHIIFLYKHTPVGIPSAQPFDEMTSSRYWMAGLVASGIAMALYTPICWLRGWLRGHLKQWVPPPWWQIWLLVAFPLSLGIPAITMTMNQPTLPPALAFACVGATLAGLTIALLAGDWAARYPRSLLWLVADGLGLMPALLLLRAVELPARGLSVSPAMVWIIAIGGLLAGVIWLAGLSLVRFWRRTPMPSAGAIFLAGLGLSYVLMPLAHYWLGTPLAYHYITTASNFFASNWGLQLLALVVAFGLAALVTVGRDWFRKRLA